MTVAVVTGAARGMGRACVEALRGTAEVIVAADLAAPEIPGTVGVACDVSDPAAVAALASRAGELGPLRALVHAAGISPTMAESRAIFAVDLVGTQLVLDAFEELVVPGAAAVCFASVAAHHVAPFVEPETAALMDAPLAPGFVDRASALLDHPGLAYGAAKWGVIRAVRRAAVRWGPRGGRVVSVSPGIIDTVMGRQELEQQPAVQEMLDRTPVGRMGTAEDVAGVVAFLLSDAASFVSGIDVVIDGGELASSASPR